MQDGGKDAKNEKSVYFNAYCIEGFCRLNSSCLPSYSSD